VVDDDGNVVDSPEACHALDWLRDGLNNERITLSDSRGFDEAGTTQAFRDDRVLMMRN